jgi:hypothetical protein
VKDIAPGQAQERGMRCNGYFSETCRSNPVGSQSHPAKPGQQPEASLASWRATVRTKRRQPEVEPSYAAPKLGMSRESLLLALVGTASPPCTGLGSRSRRGPRTRHSLPRVAQEPGRPVRLLRTYRPLRGGRAVMAPGPRLASEPVGAKLRTPTEVRPVRTQ